MSVSPDSTTASSPSKTSADTLTGWLRPSVASIGRLLSALLKCSNNYMISVLETVVGLKKCKGGIEPCAFAEGTVSASLSLSQGRRLLFLLIAGEFPRIGQCRKLSFREHLFSAFR